MADAGSDISAAAGVGEAGGGGGGMTTVAGSPGTTLRVTRSGSIRIKVGGGEEDEADRPRHRTTSHHHHHRRTHHHHRTHRRGSADATALDAAGAGAGAGAGSGAGSGAASVEAHVATASPAVHDAEVAGAASVLVSENFWSTYTRRGLLHWASSVWARVFVTTVLLLVKQAATAGVNTSAAAASGFTDNRYVLLGGKWWYDTLELALTRIPSLCSQ